MMIRMEPINAGEGLLITGRGPITCRTIRDHLGSLHLEYTEYRRGLTTRFVVTLPDGVHSGRIQEWLCKRMEGTA